MEADYIYEDTVEILTNKFSMLMSSQGRPMNDEFISQFFEKELEKIINYTYNELQEEAQTNYVKGWI